MAGWVVRHLTWTPGASAGTTRPFSSIGSSQYQERRGGHRAGYQRRDRPRECEVSERAAVEAGRLGAGGAGDGAGRDVGERHGPAPGGAEPDKRSRREVRLRAVEVAHGDDIVAQAAGDPKAPDDPTASHGARDGDGEVGRCDPGGEGDEGGDRDDLRWVVG